MSGNTGRASRAALGRRKLLGAVAASALAGAFVSTREVRAQEAVERATRGLPTPVIKDVQVLDFRAPDKTGWPLSVVKVTTDQAGLYGYGEATTAGRAMMLRMLVEQYMKPALIGKGADRIEDIWRTLYLGPYWKNDRVHYNGVSGVCDALWDIKGRQAGMPVYQLIGGKVRDAADVYMHAGARGLEPKTVVENSKKLVAQGVKNIQLDVFGRDAEGLTAGGAKAYDPDLMLKKLYKACEAFRKDISTDIKIGCDVHSMFDPIRARQFIKDAEQFGPWYWIEDPVSPDDQAALRLIRQQTSLPLSMGELYTHPLEWKMVIEERLVDYIRHHISHVGGFTNARKIAMQAEAFEVRTGWHGTPVSPVGQVARLSLDMVITNFGIHEFFPYPEWQTRVFRGITEMRAGYAWINDKPGWGVEIDESAALKEPVGPEDDRYFRRLPDGSLMIGVG